MTSYRLLLLLVVAAIASSRTAAEEVAVHGESTSSTRHGAQPSPSGGSTATTQPPTGGSTAKKPEKRPTSEQATLSVPRIPEDACVNAADGACDRVTGQASEVKPNPKTPKLNSGTSTSDKTHPTSVPDEKKATEKTSFNRKSETGREIEGKNDEAKPPESKLGDTRKLETKESSLKKNQQEIKIELKDGKLRDNEIETLRTKHSDTKKSDVKNTISKTSGNAKENPSDVQLPVAKAVDAKPPEVKAPEKSSQSKPPEVKQSMKKPSVESPNKQKEEKSTKKMPSTESDKRSEGEILAEAKPNEVKYEETKKKITGTKPIDVKPAGDASSAEYQAKPKEMKPKEVKPTEVKPTEVKPTEVKPKEVKLKEVKQKEVKLKEVKLKEVKQKEVKLHEVKPKEVKPKEVKPTEVKPTEVKPNEVIPPKEIPSESTPSARILAVLPVNVRSHFVAFAPLFRALAERGHHVDVVSHFLLPDPPKGYRDLSVNGSFPSWEGAVNLEAVAGLNALTDAIAIWSESLEICAAVFEHTAVQDILRSGQKYDLVISEIFGAECLMGFAHHFKAPLVGIISSVAPPGSLDRVGSPDHPAYISNYFLPFVPPLSFWQRAANAAYGAAVRRLKSLLCDRANDALARRYFGESLPSTNELAANTSLVLVNSHPVSNQPRPLVPAVIEVGGLHIGEPKPLPKDLEQLLSSARHGVVLLSLGTMVRLASFPAERLAALWAALGSLQQLVLIKSHDPLPGAPANVHVRPWLPQNDILSHPNVVLMITHGGLLGVQEAMAAGVPMLGVPFFSDQRLNLNAMVAKGAGLMLEHYELTEEKLKHALHRLLKDGRFRTAARALSKQFRDRPTPPLQTAVWWVEYVLRHGGAPHLRCAAADLPWPQLLLLDVAAACATALASAAALLWVVLSAVYRAIRFGTAPKERLPAVSTDGRAKRYSKKKVH